MFAVHGMAFSNEQAGTKDQKTGEEVYFEGSKKNQLNDLKKYLKTIVSDPEKEYYRKEIIKKIIAYTTSGIDTSRLYPQVVLASATKDLVQKKLIYLYLTIYSAHNQEFARMAINTYIKDLSSPNPNIRTFAARSLSNLRFKGREEYALPAFHNGLNDFVPSVKRSCLLGLTKIAVQKNRSTESHERDEALLSKFYEMLREQDSTLVCTALEAINEVEEEGISMSRKLSFYLLGNLHKYSDLQLPIVINYLQLYQPKSDQQIIDILSALQPKLKSSNSATVLAISKVFLKMGGLKPDLLSKLLKTLRKSLLSFLHNEVPEIEYVVLRHIEYIVRVLKTDLFHPDYKRFMVGGQEPSYLKATKVRLLQLTANRFNFTDVVNQFAEYLFDEVVSPHAVQALAQLLTEASESDAKFIAKTVVKNVQTAPLPLLCNSVIPLVSTYLRLYPKEFPLFVGIFYTLAEHAKEEHSRCCVIELVGDFGEFIEDAPELLALSPKDLSDKVRISLLRATTKLFLKRPQQTVSMFTLLLRQTLTDDETHLHVKDYAGYLYRGLQAGVAEFKSRFLEERAHQKAVPFSPESLQFNSLEVIYNAKSSKWALDPLKYIQLEEPGAEVQGPEQPREIHVDLESKFSKLEVENFDVTFAMSSEEFEKCWEDFEVGSSITRVVSNLEVLSEENLEELFRLWNVTVLASAESAEEIKFYCYCRVQSAEKYLGVACMECCLHKLPETATLMIKSDDDELAGFVSRYIQDIFRLNEII